MRMRTLFALMILVCTAAVLPAQDQKAMDEKAMMEAWMKAGTPSDAHKKLEPFVGNWDVKVKSWMAADAPPLESTGSAQNSWILGGRYLEQKFQGSFMDMPFNGVGYTGYDNTKKQYVSTWMDSMSTSVMVAAGNADPTGKVMAFAANMEDPVTHKIHRIDEKITIVNNDHHVMEMWAPGMDGKVYKNMEITYTRRK